jgi:hypothetical protein
LFINRFLKKTTVHENRKTEDNFAPESTHGILNTNRRQFLFLEILFYSKQLKKLQLKLSRSTTAIYPYEKPLLTVSQESS